MSTHIDPYSGIDTEDAPVAPRPPTRRILAPLYPECSNRHASATPPRVSSVQSATTCSDAGGTRTRRPVDAYAVHPTPPGPSPAEASAGAPTPSRRTPNRRCSIQEAIRTEPLQVHNFVAQSAFTPHNPFRTQSFADFAVDPRYEPPTHLRLYAEAATHGSTMQYARAGPGEFLLRRLSCAAGPVANGAHTVTNTVINDTLEKLLVGDWFYKWTRSNRVHRRYMWLHLRRGSLMWSRFEHHHLYHKAEINLADVTQVKPEALQDSTSGTTYYRMGIFTTDRVAWFGTAIREKFDGWFKVIQLLTQPNLSSGVPGMWGRPSSIVSYGHPGAVGRWASRYSPLHAIVQGASGPGAGEVARPDGLVNAND